MCGAARSQATRPATQDSRALVIFGAAAHLKYSCCPFSTNHTDKLPPLMLTRTRPEVHILAAISLPNLVISKSNLLALGRPK
jgi:hypothetical protein